MSRRIVAAAGPDGRSCVVSDEAIVLSNPAQMNVINLWNGAAGRVDNAAEFVGSFAPFSMTQMTDSIYSVMIAEYAPGLGAADPGMHYTDTADHFYVIEGEVVLVLEAGDVVLRAGDVGICRGAVHGWRNDGGVIARLLTFVLPAEKLAGR